MMKKYFIGYFDMRIFQWIRITIQRKCSISSDSVFTNMLLNFWTHTPSLTKVSSVKVSELHLIFITIGGVSSTFRDSKTAPFKWRERLKKFEVLKIQVLLIFLKNVI